MKRKVMLFCLCGLLLLSGCAKPESEDLSAQLSAESDASSLQEEQGRVVRTAFEIPGEDQDFTIQATVTVPEHAVEAGTVQHTLPTIREIEQEFLAGEKMQKVSDMEEDTWMLYGKNKNTFRRCYSVDINNRGGSFQNTEVKDVSDYPYSEETCTDTKMSDALQSLKKQALALYQKFGMKVKASGDLIAKEKDSYLADIQVYSLLEDTPVVWGTGQFATDGCFLSDEGVSSMTFCGTFTKSQGKEVSVISVDQLLNVLRQKAEDGELESGSTITNIQLAYYVDYDTWEFYPVWVLTDADQTIVESINAQTGGSVKYKKAATASKKES